MIPCPFNLCDGSGWRMVATEKGDAMDRCECHPSKQEPKLDQRQLAAGER